MLSFDGDSPQVQPKAPLLQILRVAGAQEEVFTLKEVSCQVKCQVRFKYVSMQPVILTHNNVLPEKQPFQDSVILL